MAPVSSCVLRFFNVGREDEVLESVHLHDVSRGVIVGAPDSERAARPEFIELPQICSGDFVFNIHLVFGLCVSTDHFGHSVAVFPRGSNVSVATPDEHVVCRRTGDAHYAALTIGSRILLTDSTDARVVCDVVYPADDPNESGIDSENDAATFFEMNGELHGRVEHEGESLTPRQLYDRKMAKSDRLKEWVHEYVYRRRVEEVETHSIRMAYLNEVVEVSSDGGDDGADGADPDEVLVEGVLDDDDFWDY